MRVQEVVFTYTAAGCGNHFGKQFVTVYASGTQAYSVTQHYTLDHTLNRNNTYVQ